MTKYREIIRFAQPLLHLSQEKIAASCGVSKKTVNKVLAAAKSKNLAWPLPASYTDAVIEGILFPPEKEAIPLLPNVCRIMNTSGKNFSVTASTRNFVHRPFQKKEGSRYEIFRDEELPLLAPLPATPYELAEWKQATVQYNYHISIDGMLYSVPYEYIILFLYIM